MAARVIFDTGTAMCSAQAITAALMARDRGAGGQHITMSMLNYALQYLWPDAYWNHLYTGSDAPAHPPLSETELFTSAESEPKLSVKDGIAANAGRFETMRAPFPIFGTFTAPKFPVSFSGSPCASRPGPPMMGEHTNKILSEIGMTTEKIGEMLKSGDAVSTHTLMGAMAKPLPDGPGKQAVLKAGKAFGYWEKMQRGRTMDGSAANTAAITSGHKPGSGPMCGTAVLDFCSLVAGPMAAMVLADQGADCTKVELPQSPDPSREMGQQPKSGASGMGACHAVLNRNKKSVAVDYTTAAGLAALQPLLQKADVVFVDGDANGALSALSQATGPGAVIVSIEKCGGEFMVQARSGATADQLDSKGSPTFLKTCVNEKSTAMYASIAATAALYARNRGTCGGQSVSVDMMGVALHVVAPDVLMNHMWTSPGGTGAPKFPTIGQCYQTIASSDGLYGFTLSLSDKECQDFMDAFAENIDPEIRKKFVSRDNIADIWVAFFVRCQRYRCRQGRAEEHQQECGGGGAAPRRSPPRPHVPDRRRPSVRPQACSRCQLGLLGFVANQDADSRVTRRRLLCVLCRCALEARRVEEAHIRSWISEAYARNL